MGLVVVLKSYVVIQMGHVTGKKMVKRININKHFRKGKPVKKHKRKIRALGKKVKFKPAGTFYVAQDDKGNLRGSRIVPFKKDDKTKKVNPKKLPRSRLKKSELMTIDTDYFRGKIKFNDWINKRQKLMGITD